MDLFNAIWKRLRRQRVDESSRPWPSTLHLELSRACNLLCHMCPRGEGCADDALMSDKVFEAVFPSVHLFQYVHLTGLGEPLLDARLPDIAQRLANEGCRVSFTTNGTLLTEEMARRVLAVGVDAVNISCEASTAESYQKTRGKNLFQHVVDNTRRFCELKREIENPPFVQWVFLMMKSNIDEMPATARLACECGVDRFVAKHVETWQSEDGLSEALFNTGRVPDLTEDEQRRYQDVVAETTRVIDKFDGVALEVHPQCDGDEQTCLARPLDAVIVDLNGDVCPCCYTFPMDTRPYQTERAYEEKTLVVGNVLEGSLETLLDTPGYRAFTAVFHERNIPDVCRGCLQLKRRQF